jgi:hypothetical protein
VPKVCPAQLEEAVTLPGAWSGYGCLKALGEGVPGTAAAHLLPTLLALPKLALETPGVHPWASSLGLGQKGVSSTH